jgi:uncharacterized protein
MPYLSEIWTYPVKSLRGISHAKALVERRGLELDRRWMVVDTENKCITQREESSLALIDVELNAHELILSAPQMSSLIISLNDYDILGTKVQIWDDECEALLMRGESEAWFSEYLKKPVRLVYMPERSERQVDEDYAPHGSITGFSDAFPFLLISEASLADLNSRLDEAVPMNRFRPNLVIKGTEAFEEDTWKRIKIGEIIFEVAKPCARCVLTTINQNTAEKGKEPLATLSKYRMKNNKVLFGQNLYQHNLGELKVGYQIEILE